MTAGFDFVATSNVGLIRTGNEDAGLASTRLIAVADGMGGHAAGEIASATVINSLFVELANIPMDIDASRDWLERNIFNANDRLGEIVAVNPETRGMGTTLSAVLLAENSVVIAHVGDSRVYRLRNGEFEQITKDHTYVQMLVDNGEITAAEAERHPRRNLMIRAIDGIHDLNLDISVREVQLGDRFLVCSDGLSGVIHESRLKEILLQPDLTQISSQLIEFALAAGAPDNVTLVIGEYQSEVHTDLAFMVGSPIENQPLQTPSVEETRSNRKWIPYVLAGVFGFGILLAGFIGWWNQQWYVGIAEQNVAIYHGIPQDLFGFELSSIETLTEIKVSQLAEIDSELLVRGIVVEDKVSAETLIADLSSRLNPDCTTADC